jgi:hypothetical protein
VIARTIPGIRLVRLGASWRWKFVPQSRSASSGCASDGVWAWLRRMFSASRWMRSVSCPSPRSSQETNQAVPWRAAGRLDVGGLLAGLPAPGDDQGAGDGRALGAVDVLGVAEAHASEVLAGDGSPTAGHVELDQHLAGRGDGEDFAAAAVLDPLDAGLVVLVDQRDPVALADAVVDAGHRDFELTKFAALCTEVLGAGVEPADLLI